MNTTALQRALAALGFKPGPIDGKFGALTRKALVGFQAQAGIKPDGIAGPVTLAALRAALVKGGKPPVSTVPAGPLGPPWYQELLRRKGLHETRARSALVAWLRSDGRTLGDPAKLPWCGDAIETCIALTLPTEPLPSNPYLARNWLKFGVPLVRPALGAVIVFWRGSKVGTSGHVGLYAGEDAAAYHVLGGNQSNAVTIARLDKARVLGFRWPAKFPLPSGGPVHLNKAGALSTNEA
jgi:uncharacterized protein (TIGR02594 family)